MLKVIIYLLTIGTMAVSCGSSRRLANSERTRETMQYSASTRKMPPILSFPGKRVYKHVQGTSAKDFEKMGNVSSRLGFSGNIETSNWLQFKYSLLTDVPVEALDNINMLYYMEEWYGTPYKYGGSTQNGIDCSAFSLGLVGAVFSITIPRTAREQYETTERIEKYELHEGDLVFFNTRGGISHVGVYIINNKFVHASVSSGVMISDLNDAYYMKRYIGAGRIRQSM